MSQIVEPEAGQQNPAEAIIQRFGGLSRLARAYPLPSGTPRPVTTVQSWKDRGRIPQEHWRGIMEAGETHGITIRIEEFLAPQQEAA